MKRIAFLVVACCIALVASAQVSFNVKAGVGLGSFFGSKPAQTIEFLDESEELNFSITSAWRVGVGMEYNFSKNWSFAPSLNFTVAGSQTDEYMIDQYVWKTKAELYYLQLPLDIQWKKAIGRTTTLGIYAGPYLGIGVGGESEMTVGDETLKHDSFSKDGFERFDLGVNCGVNFDINHFIVGADFGFGLLENHKKGKGTNFTAMAVFGYRF